MTTDAAMRVAELGERTLVMHGAGAADAARRMLPRLPDACFVPTSPDALRGAVEHGLAQIVLIAGVGEQADIAGGTAVLAEITADMDGGPALTAEVAAAGTPERAYELWESAGRLGPCGRELCRRTATELERRAARMAGAPAVRRPADTGDAPEAGAAGAGVSPLAAQVVLVDGCGERMVGMFGRMAR